jgi:hypothetical protein
MPESVLENRYVLTFRLNEGVQVVQLQKNYKNKKGTDTVLAEVPAGEKKKILKELKELL